MTRPLAPLLALTVALAPLAFLAAINGLMGSRHDEMVAEALSGRRHYDTPAPLANETRSRVENLLAHYPL